MEGSKDLNMICEQGDMGLFCDPISDHDKIVLKEQEEKEKEKRSSKKQ